MNVLRLTLSPRGLGASLANYRQWRSHVLEKLRAQIHSTGDPILFDLHRELEAYPEPALALRNQASSPTHGWHSLVVPFQLVTTAGTLSFYSTTTIFGTPMEITLSEVSVESFYPADALTREVFKTMTGNLAPATNRP